MASNQIYFGIVEDRSDPLRLGRCKVRVAGLHTHDTQILPTKDLPWASTVRPVSGSANYSNGAPKNGSEVLVVFSDYPDCQMPVVIGVIDTIPQPKSVWINQYPDQPQLVDIMHPQGADLPLNEVDRVSKTSTTIGEQNSVSQKKLASETINNSTKDTSDAVDIIENAKGEAPSITGSSVVAASIIQTFGSAVPTHTERTSLVQSAIGDSVTNTANLLIIKSDSISKSMGLNFDIFSGITSLGSLKNSIGGVFSDDFNIDALEQNLNTVVDEALDISNKTPSYVDSLSSKNSITPDEIKPKQQHEKSNNTKPNKIISTQKLRSIRSFSLATISDEQTLHENISNKGLQSHEQPKFWSDISTVRHSGIEGFTEETKNNLTSGGIDKHKLDINNRVFIEQPLSVWDDEQLVDNNKFVDSFTSDIKTSFGGAFNKLNPSLDEIGDITKQLYRGINEDQKTNRSQTVFTFAENLNYPAGVMTNRKSNDQSWAIKSDIESKQNKQKNIEEQGFWETIEELSNKGDQCIENWINVNVDTTLLTPESLQGVLNSALSSIPAPFKRAVEILCNTFFTNDVSINNVNKLFNAITGPGGTLFSVDSNGITKDINNIANDIIRSLISNGVQPLVVVQGMMKEICDLMGVLEDTLRVSAIVFAVSKNNLDTQSATELLHNNYFLQSINDTVKSTIKGISYEIENAINKIYYIGEDIVQYIVERINHVLAKMLDIFNVGTMFTESVFNAVPFGMLISLAVNNTLMAMLPGGLLKEKPIGINPEIMGDVYQTGSYYAGVGSKPEQDTRVFNCELAKATGNDKREQYGSGKISPAQCIQGGLGCSNPSCGPGGSNFKTCIKHSF